MSLQGQIDDLTLPAASAPYLLGGLGLDRSMLGIALRSATEGGKRFRPWLFTTAHAALASDASPQVETDVLDRIGAAIELMHTAFVVHDDVIDNDDTRRGRTSVPGWFRGSTTSPSPEYPRAGAILTGDLALAAAIRGIATCGASPAVTTALLDLFDATLRDSAVGELADVRFTLNGHLPTSDDALAVAELKTAAYSFVLPLRAAAIVAGANDDVVEQIGQLGRHLGIAFQLRDDLLGTFAADTLGKDPDGDLREGKRTPLVVHAAASAHWSRIEPHLGDPDLTPAHADDVRRALVAAGSVQHVEGLVARHLRLARRHSARLGLTETVVDPLTATWQPVPVDARIAASGSISTAGVA
ncbi:polyprenyl synthetase family protein [Nocardioides yefusunii]|uniref:Polyprenyl synthetase family protein n=1 Tax=Nocardioides yefusunii TaxID=2500546 RepID=A0ABW1QUT3_9ACTN|nr:polyprenyl synthetase family protein [Nocardioides yefusunii]